MIRETRQRIAIRRAFESADGPISLEDVLKSAQQTVSSLGIATVYRSIKDLIREGWLISVTLPGQTARYEVAGKGHHHHFHCRHCGQVFELLGCVEGFRNLIPKGFRVTGHEFVLYGYCQPCGRRRHVSA